MKNLLLLPMLLLLGCAPAYAQQSEEVTTCNTPDKVLEIVFTNVPDATLVKVSDTKPLYMEFTSPSHPTNLQVYFDENNCATHTLEVSNVES